MKGTIVLILVLLLGELLSALFASYIVGAWYVGTICCSTGYIVCSLGFMAASRIDK